MRIKIVRTPPITSIDGIRLDYFAVGREYDVGNSIASLFLAEGWAEPVPLDSPPPIEPFSTKDVYESLTRFLPQERRNASKSAKDVVTRFFERDRAAERLRFPRRRRKPKAGK